MGYSRLPLITTMPSLKLRPVRPEDMEFLYQVYSSTRQEELALVDWDSPQVESFLRMQFNAQHAYYQEHYRRGEFQIILLGEEPAGRLYVDRRPDELRIVDIAILPWYRDRGIGTACLKEVLAEGERSGLPVTIHVERFNRARRLYERLGFHTAADKGVYLLMEWCPAQAGVQNAG
jgi:ribosomal protein S18 acetylase RimI-like enzyme